MTISKKKKKYDYLKVVVKDREAWRTTTMGLQSQTRLSD